MRVIDSVTSKFAVLRNAPTRKLIVSMLAVLFLSIILLGVYTYKTKDSRAQEIRSARQLFISYNNRLATLPQPSSILPGERDSVLDYLITGSDRLAADAEDTNSELPPRFFVQLNYGLFNRDVGSAYRTTRETSVELTTKLNYHSRVLKAVKPVLIYNPAADFYDGVPDTEYSQRIARAEKGLDQTLVNIRKLPIDSNDNLNELFSAVTSLQNSLSTFASSGNKKAWQQAVHEAQITIIDNRQAYWQSLQPSLSNSLSEANAQLATIESKLQQ